jgi:hypothetical protein
MVSLTTALQRVKRQLMFHRISAALLNALLMFLAMGIFLVLLGLPLWYAAFPAVVYFIPSCAKKLRDVKIKEAEEKVPELRWQLRTTEDTLDQHNEVVEGLHQRVFQKIMAIKNSYLADDKRGYKVSGIMGMIVLLFVFSFFNVMVVDVTDPNSVSGFFGKADALGDVVKGTLDDTDLFDTKKGERDIYGEEDLAELGNKELELELQRENNELDYDKQGALEGKEFVGQHGLGNIGATSDASYEEHIDEEDQKVVKNYFEQLTGE